VKIPGPISLPSWSVFDQAKALSFHCLVLVFCCFITANSHVSFKLIVMVIFSIWVL
jgi:hypothetical protein